ncbi:MAG: metallophosphoesterase family protein [Parvularculaceae bacterium]
MLRFAHISDPHLPLRVSPPLSAIANKRMLGLINWRRNRSKRHRPEVLDKIACDLADQAPDFTVVTGDVANIALPDEFSIARDWLETLGPPEKVMFLPGNHDAYVRTAWDDTLGVLAAYMAGERDGEIRTPRGFDDFPFIRRQGSVGFLALNSSPPTAPGLATGRVGPEQRRRMEAGLRALGGEGLLRVVALHHPPMKGILSPRKSLDDADALGASLAAAGAELVIHGHGHKPSFAAIDSARGPIAVHGVASASYAGRAGHPAAQYHLYTATRDEAGGFTLELEVRGLDNPAGAVVSLEKRIIALPGARRSAA